jgi:DNA-binding NarL/FixJ family response regulator
MHTLSNRELHIFRRLGRKQGPTSIATELGVSLKTIETYQRRIIEKLHFSDGRHLRSAAENWVLGTSVYPKALCSSAIARYRRTTKRRKP